MPNDLHAELVPYTGKVYGFCVPPHHLIRTRRNGCEQWTGNSGRDIGGYTADQTPGRGGSRGAKRMSGFDVNALLAHGACFMSGVNILTEEQGWMEINEIVRHRLRLHVASVDGAGRIEYKSIIDWSCRSVPASELVIVRTVAKGAAGTNARHRAIRCTASHQFYIGSESAVRSSFCRATWRTP